MVEALTPCHREDKWMMEALTPFVIGRLTDQRVHDLSFQDVLPNFMSLADRCEIAEFNLISSSLLQLAKQMSVTVILAATRNIL